MIQTLLNTAHGSFHVNRYPLRKNELLRAWDAADELVLEHIHQVIPKGQQDDKRLLIINDNFGALCVSLNQYRPSMLSDSFIAQQGCHANITLNSLSQVTQISSIDQLSGQYDLVIIKVQKSLAQLEDQLHKLRPVLHAQSIIVGCAMVKMLHSSTLNLFESILGPTTTSLAKKKARLVFCKFAPNLPAKENPHPQSFPLEGTDWSILNHANVFSRGKLDIGCRFFIEHIPASDDAKTIIDLGCGNGIVGLVAAQKNPNAKIIFYDESHMAVDSARQNFAQISRHNNAEFVVADCLSDCQAQSADLILNNPPFHQQNAIGDFIAWQMFTQSYTSLKVGGQLMVIGNRHLDYQNKLKKLFGNCEQVAANKKFVILRAVKK